MKKLPVDVGLVGDLMAFHSSFGFEEYKYLDTETGEVIHFCDDMIPPDIFNVEKEELMEMLKDKDEVTREIALKAFEIAWEDESGRYKKIPELSSKLVYKKMEEFVYNIEDERLRTKVLYTIKGKGAFARFRAFLDLHEEYRQAWLKFRDEFQREFAIEWLNSIGIDPIDKIQK